MTVVTEPRVHLVIGEHTDARLQPVPPEHREYHRRGRRIEGIEVDRRPRHIPHERTIEEHRRNTQPVTAQHLTDRSETTRRRRENRDTPTAELLNGCKRGRVDDAIDTPQGGPNPSPPVRSAHPPRRSDYECRTVRPNRQQHGKCPRMTTGPGRERRSVLDLGLSFRGLVRARRCR